jgi:hypothetical protein
MVRRYLFELKKPTPEDQGDRYILEYAEARTLAHSFTDKAWLAKALQVSEKKFGSGSADRILKYMRIIWKEEMGK